MPITIDHFKIAQEICKAVEDKLNGPPDLRRHDQIPDYEPRLHPIRCYLMGIETDLDHNITVKALTHGRVVEITCMGSAFSKIMDEGERWRLKDLAQMLINNARRRES